MKWLHGFGEKKGCIVQLLFFPMTRSNVLHQAVVKDEEGD